MQQPGGSPYGVPPSDISPFSSQGTAAAGAGSRSHLLTIDPLQPPPLQHQQQHQHQHQLAEAASPISSRPPAGVLVSSGSASTTPRLSMSAGAAAPGFDELGPGMSANFADDDAALDAAAGEEAERCGASGNRWPRQETLALLKIRSEMDAAFRDATLKGPLWDEVSRKLAELGYKRSAKKCKEKFENVHKYYKRTKEGRAGRQDGKSYRFFSQLEALHSGAGAGGSPFAAAPSVTAVASAPLAAASPTPISFSAAMMAGSGSLVGRIQPSPLSAAPPLPFVTTPARPILEMTQVPGIPSSSVPMNIGGVSFSSNSSSSASLSDSDDEATEEAGGSLEGGRKRKRSSGGSSSSRKMMAFFEGLMKQVMERQEAMQQRFLETIEKREQDRMIREEAWRRQEMARLTREQELFAQERAMAASRDATLLSYIQKITGQSVQLPTMPVGTISVTTTTIPPPQQPQAQPYTTPTQAAAHPQQPPQQQQPPPQQPLQQQKPPMPVQPLQQQPPPPPQQQRQQEIQLHHQSTEIVLRHQPPSGTELVEVSEGQDTGGGGSIGFEPMSASSSRWPKAEVHALIKLRSGLESRYQEAGAKGPLWEEISAGMQRLGYNRSSKRCKEKWENINKYFKKVKESNKKRPEDAKTCPYFHQLDALYRNKQIGLAGSGAIGAQQQQQQQLGQDQPNQQLNPQERTEAPLIMAAAAVTQTLAQSQQAQAEVTEKSGSNTNNNGTTSRNGGNPEDGGGIQVQTSNGGLPPSFFEEGMKKPEDIVKDLMAQTHSPAMMDDCDKMEEADSDNMDQDDEEDEDEDDGKMQYKIQFQRQNVGGGSGGGGGGGNGGSGGSNTSTPSAATTAAGSFMAMVK